VFGPPEGLLNMGIPYMAPPREGQTIGPSSELAPKRVIGPVYFKRRSEYPPLFGGRPLAPL